MLSMSAVGLSSHVRCQASGTKKSRPLGNAQAESPQRLKILREHALIESAVSSNRIEGVTVEQDRVRPVVIGKARLRDRDEEEVRGYRDALRLIHERHGKPPVSAKTIRELHRLSRGKLGDAGDYRTSESEIIEVQTDGRRRVRFRAVQSQ